MAVSQSTLVHDQGNHGAERVLAGRRVRSRRQPAVGSLELPQSARVTLRRAKQHKLLTLDLLIALAAPGMSGATLLPLIKREIASADRCCLHASSMSSAGLQDDVILYRLALGRLLYWLKHGGQPLGITEEDRAVYASIEKARRDYRMATDMKLALEPSRPAMARRDPDEVMSHRHGV